MYVDAYLLLTVASRDSVLSGAKGHRFFRVLPSELLLLWRRLSPSLAFRDFLFDCIRLAVPLLVLRLPHELSFFSISLSDSASPSLIACEKLCKKFQLSEKLIFI